MSKNLVRNWMTPKPITISAKSSLPEAYWRMIDNKVRRLPVVENKKVVGIITIEDLRRADPPKGFGLDLVKISNMLSKMPISIIMSKDPLTISPDKTLLEAAQLMLDHEISTLPVIEENQLVGIITESDIFRAFVKLEEMK